MHEHTHIYARLHTLSYTSACTHARRHAHKRNRCMCARRSKIKWLQVYLHMTTDTYTWLQTHTQNWYICAHARTHARTHAHTHTHTHTHTQSLAVRERACVCVCVREGMSERKVCGIYMFMHMLNYCFRSAQPRFSIHAVLSSLWWGRRGEGVGGGGSRGRRVGGGVEGKGGYILGLQLKVPLSLGWLTMSIAMLLLFDPFSDWRRVSTTEPDYMLFPMPNQRILDVHSSWGDLFSWWDVKVQELFHKCIPMSSQVLQLNTSVSLALVFQCFGRKLAQ